MASVNISDGVITYSAIVPDKWNEPLNFRELKQSFARGYDTGDAEHYDPFVCHVSGDFDGEFLLHCNGKGGTIEDDLPCCDPEPIQWDG